MDNIEKNSCTLKPDALGLVEKTKLIYEILPGGDCKGHGGCNFKSCHECAEAIVKGASIDSCPACSQNVVDSIASIMSVESVKVIEKRAFIRCNGQAAGKIRLAGCESCEEAKNIGFKENECQYGCIGIGSCIDSCTFNAMSIDDGNIFIDKEKCNGCGACVDICPQMIISIIPKDATNFIPCASKNSEEKTRRICGYGCIGCGECEEACPEGAVKVIENCAVIDYEKCVGCVACTVKCKKKIIIDELHDLTKIKPTVAFVRCSGGKSSKIKFDALGVENCQEASKIRTAEMGLCTTGCTGLGDCTKVCRFDALHIVDGTAKVNPDNCVGCLDCTYVCPNHLITEVAYKGSKIVACASNDNLLNKQKICLLGCIGCGDCAANCPNGAISMENGCAIVDSSICENCNVCSYVCSRSALMEQSVPEINYLQRKALGL